MLENSNQPQEIQAETGLGQFGASEEKKAVPNSSLALINLINSGKIDDAKKMIIAENESMKQEDISRNNQSYQIGINDALDEFENIKGIGTPSFA